MRTLCSPVQHRSGGGLSGGQAVDEFVGLLLRVGCRGCHREISLLYRAPPRVRGQWLVSEQATGDASGKRAHQHTRRGLLLAAMSNAMSRCTASSMVSRLSSGIGGHDTYSP